ncbi:hypothetical protein ZIOFF_046404 [Zingiber officinale]|uniref:Uncharacterized protein n=1 Tax=Zingiber officinale TaxID=94328 RepID=A0A8J5L2L1_ZINOF|nr:hypothetical protein ZIOFF_046404 [Zingiber officinale]
MAIVEECTEPLKLGFSRSPSTAKATRKMSRRSPNQHKVVVTGNVDVEVLIKRLLVKLGKHVEVWSDQKTLLVATKEKVDQGSHDLRLDMPNYKGFDEDDVQIVLQSARSGVGELCGSERRSGRAVWRRLPFSSSSGGGRYDRGLWEAYVLANKLFSERVVEVINPEEDYVWIHDYHLMALPTFLRRHFNRLRLGFFLHVPFPSSEIYRTLPFREEILKALLNCDIIGFHTFDYARHFLSCCSRILGIEYQSKRGYIGLDYFGRTIGIKIMPVGIHMGQLQSVLHLPDKEWRVDDLRQQSDGKTVLLGVDDMDIFKGINLKLLAFEHMLKIHHKWQGRAVLVQIANPARAQGKDLKEIQDEIQESWQRINRTFGHEGYSPIQRLKAQQRACWLSQSSLAALRPLAITATATYFDEMQLLEMSQICIVSVGVVDGHVQDSDEDYGRKSGPTSRASVLRVKSIIEVSKSPLEDRLSENTSTDNLEIQKDDVFVRKCANISGGVGWASAFILAADITQELVLVKSNSFEQLKENENTGVGDKADSVNTFKSFSNPMMTTEKFGNVNNIITHIKGL